MRLNLGCGSQVVSGWTNVDYALGARLRKIPLFRYVNSKLKLFSLDWDDRIVLHDLTTDFPWSSESVDCIYSSHTLEHMTREEGLAFLKECARVLRYGGTLRIVIPDLAGLVADYMSGSLPAENFVAELGVLPASRMRRGVRAKIQTLFEYPHACMYDAPSLLRALEAAGLVGHVRLPFESAITDIAAIELESRTERALIVEATRELPE